MHNLQAKKKAISRHEYILIREILTKIIRFNQYVVSGCIKATYYSGRTLNRDILINKE